MVRCGLSESARRRQLALIRCHSWSIASIRLLYLSVSQRLLLRVFGRPFKRGRDRAAEYRFLLLVAAVWPSTTSPAAPAFAARPQLRASANGADGLARRSLRPLHARLVASFCLKFQTGSGGGYTFGCRCCPLSPSPRTLPPYHNQKHTL